MTSKTKTPTLARQAKRKGIQVVNLWSDNMEPELWWAKAEMVKRPSALHGAKGKR